MIKDKYSQVCSTSITPGVVYNEGSWLNVLPTLDQQRIENVLRSISLKNKTILHIGIGNSNIAKIFGKKLKHLDGITVMNDEKEYADSLNIPNYTAYLVNKYSDELLRLTKTYDIIIDNNFSSFACCKYHFLNMFETYVNILKDNGLLITDKRGLAYSKLSTSFAMTYGDLVELEQLFPIKFFKFNKNVIGALKIKSRSNTLLNGR